MHVILCFYYYFLLVPVWIANEKMFLSLRHWIGKLDCLRQQHNTWLVLDLNKDHLLVTCLIIILFLVLYFLNQLFNKHYFYLLFSLFIYRTFKNVCKHKLKFWKLKKKEKLKFIKKFTKKRAWLNWLTSILAVTKFVVQIFKNNDTFHNHRKKSWKEKI